MGVRAVVSVLRLVFQAVLSCFLLEISAPQQRERAELMEFLVQLLFPDVSPCCQRLFRYVK